VEGDIRELAREHAPDAIKRLVQLLHSRNERVAVTACGAILDRAYGRAPQAVRMDAEVGFRGSTLLAALAALPECEPPALSAERAEKIFPANDGVSQSFCACRPLSAVRRHALNFG